MMTKQYGWYIALLLIAALQAGCAQTQKKEHVAGQSPAEINVDLGLQYMREGMKTTAMEVFLKALEQDPNLPSAHNAIAVLYESMGENEKADKHFRRAISLDPKDARANNNYGSFLCRNKRWKEAEPLFLKAATDPLSPTPHLAYTNAGICAYGVNDFDKADQYWRKALDLQPQFAPALLQMARLSVQREDFLRARAYLQRLHEVTRPTAESLWLGIQTERVLGDKNAEASYSLRLRNGFPDSPQAKQLQGN